MKDIKDFTTVDEYGLLTRKVLHQHIRDSFEFRAIYEEHDPWKGGSRFIFQDGERFGWVYYRWDDYGISGALQSARTRADIALIRDAMLGFIHWCESKEALMASLSDLLFSDINELEQLDRVMYLFAENSLIILSRNRSN